MEDVKVVGGFYEGSGAKIYSRRFSIWRWLKIGDGTLYHVYLGNGEWANIPAEHLSSEFQKYETKPGNVWDSLFSKT